MAAGADGIGLPPLCPDRFFVSSDWTYGDVHALAAGIRSSPAVRGRDPWCVCTEDRGVLAAAFLAAAHGGPALVLPHAVSASALAEARQASGFRVILADRDIPAPAGADLLHPREIAGSSGRGLGALDLDDVCLHLFTGGTTDRPQIWSKTAGNLLCEARYLVDAGAFLPGDRVLATVPPCHIYGLLFSVLAPFLAGAQVFPGAPAFPGEIRDAVEGRLATVLVAVPVHYRLLRQSPLRPAELRRAFSSAGFLEEEDSLAFLQATGVPVTEVYGSTETGGVALRERRSAGPLPWRPFSSVEWIRREDRLLVRSPYLSPDLPRDRDGFYVTGDRIAGPAGGGFHLLGRADDIVKVGGRRVDLREVQEKLRGLPGVAEAYVLAMSVCRGRGNDIVAFVATSRSERELRERASALLPPFAVPRRFVTVPFLPRLASGKYDRAALDNLLRVRGTTPDGRAEDAGGTP